MRQCHHCQQTSTIDRYTSVWRQYKNTMAFYARSARAVRYWKCCSQTLSPFFATELHAFRRDPLIYALHV